jgi:hypothetical protein
MNDLTDEKIQELVQQYLKKYIEGLETRHLDDDSPIVTREDFHTYLGDLDSYKNDIIEYLGIGDYETVEKNVALLLEENAIEGINKDSAAYVKLCRGVLRAQLQGIEIEKKQMSSGLIETLEDRFREEPVSSIRTSNGREKGLLISEAIDRFADEAKTNWRDKTKDENLAILRLFKESGRRHSNSGCFTEDGGDFKQTLRKLPPNIKKNPKYRNKTIPEIVRMEVPQPMSDTTISKYLTRVGALFDYATENGL